jgi:hypothetical protein
MKNYIAAMCFTTFLVAPAFAQNSAPINGVGNSSGQQRHHEHQRGPIHVTDKSPQWEKYLAAGEQFKIKGDLVRAKQYYLEALSQLERTPRTSDHLTGAISRIEHDLLDMYPTYPKDPPRGEGPSQIKFDEEQISVLSRLNRLNKVYPSPGNLLFEAIDTQIKLTQADMEKNKQAEASKGASGQSQTQ